MSFIGAIQSFLGTRPPWFLRRKNWGRFLEGFGFVLDASLETLQQGMALAQPLNCDASALPVLAYDRELTLYSTEPVASQRYRLSQWWQLHRQFGTHEGQLRNMQPFFLPGVLPRLRIFHMSGDGSTSTCHTLDADGTYHWERCVSPWNWDGVASAWSRYWLVIDISTLGFAPPTWDGPQAWDGSSVWGGTFTADQIADIVAAVTEAQDTTTMLWGVMTTSDATLFDSTVAAATLPDGSTTWPCGNWWSPIDPVTGKPSWGASVTMLYNMGRS